LVTRSTQAHQALMAGHMTNLDAPFRDQLSSLQHALAAQSGQAAQSQAYGVMYQSLQQQAGLWAYVEQFRMLVPICLLLVPIILLFKKAKGPAPAGAGGH
jgi:DHA2 family multidrug resistance protein